MLSSGVRNSLLEDLLDAVLSLVCHDSVMRTLMPNELDFELVQLSMNFLAGFRTRFEI